MTIQELKKDKGFQKSMATDKSFKNFVDEMDKIIAIMENTLSEIKKAAKAKGIEPEVI